MNALHEFKNSHHVLEFVLLTSALLIFRAISFFVVGDRHVHESAYFHTTLPMECVVLWFLPVWWVKSGISVYF